MARATYIVRFSMREIPRDRRRERKSTKGGRMLTKVKKLRQGSLVSDWE